MGFHVDELYSHVTDSPFAIFYLSSRSTPSSFCGRAHMNGQFHLSSTPKELLFVVQMFAARQNDEGANISQYLGSAVIDVSQCGKKTYHLVVRDSSRQPPIMNGRVSVQLTQIPNVALETHLIQRPDVARAMFSAAESNLKWIEGFGSKGLRPIVRGLHWVHSPYYVNHLGVTLPSGAFCMIETTLDNNKARAIESHRQRLQVSLFRNTMSAADFVANVSDMMKEGSIRSKHLRCLAVVADALTLHARLDIQYTPDVRWTTEGFKGTERWDIPREPSTDTSGVSFTGDCEDFAREVYQHCKEIYQWTQPKLDGTLMEALSAVLHVYVPTIEQGAVDHNAHSKYITYEAPYRNHIWAALHPRDSWRTKCRASMSLTKLYARWPLQACEKTLPMIHLEGTGDVYPVATDRKPGFIAKMQKKQLSLELECPYLATAETPDISLQCRHKSSFYKFAIACMTDVFTDQGVLDYTYVSDNCYGVSIHNWIRGKYAFRPSVVHSQTTMERIRSMLSMERPVPPILTKSTIEKYHHIVTGYALRYGQRTSFKKIPREAGYAIYNVGGQKWHELYFLLASSSGSSSSNDTSLLLI